jgi:hypothetical protein
MVDRSLVVSTGNTTLVKEIKVGRPVRRIVQATTNINSLDGVSTADRTDGSLLIYNSNTELWEATVSLEDQDINGGSY